MRRLMIALAALLCVTQAYAQIVPALPFQLQNNTVADATQVMANFNQILNNVNANAAHSGSNSDITALLGLTTPLAPSVGGTSTFIGGTSTGAANVQVVTPTTPTTFSLTAGYRVVFISGFLNTDDTTLNVAGSGAIHIYRQTQLGLRVLVGGELNVGSLIEVMYDGSVFQLQGRFDYVGDIRDNIGGAPQGWANTDGSCQSQTGKFATLYSIASTTWGSCAGGQFALPNLINRSTVAAGGGGSGACGTGTISAACGAVNTTIALNNLPSFGVIINLPGVMPVTSVSISGVQVNAGSGNLAPQAGGAGSWNGISTLNWSFTGNNFAMNTQSPVLAVVKMIKL